MRKRDHDRIIADMKWQCDEKVASLEAAYQLLAERYDQLMNELNETRLWPTPPGAPVTVQGEEMSWLSMIDDEEFGRAVEDASSFTEEDWVGVNRLLEEGWDIRQHATRQEAEEYLNANAHGSRV